MQDLIAAFVIMAAAWLNVEPPAELPIVEYVTQAQLEEIRGDGGLETVALYDYSTRTIFLNETADIENNIYDQAVLYHEVFHDVQYMAGIPWELSCQKHLEKQAYEATEEFLKPHGKSIFTENDPNGYLNGLAYIFVTECLLNEGDGWGPPGFPRMHQTPE
jgi:hypothetical protein